MKMPLIVLGCAIIGFVMLLLAIRKVKSPVGKPCSVCGVTSRYGYSQHAEQEADKIKPMCFGHLRSQLESDYEGFRGRAVVVEPADGPPCYVFQPVQEWR